MGFCPKEPTSSSIPYVWEIPAPCGVGGGPYLRHRVSPFISDSLKASDEHNYNISLRTQYTAKHLHNCWKWLLASSCVSLLSVRPSVLIKQLRSHWKNFH